MRGAFSSSERRKSMFITQMPESFKVGDTTVCQINDELAQLTWRSPDTLVIGATDARHIVKTHVEDGMRVFICGDADDSQYSVEEIPGEGFIIFKQGDAS
jgi:hypothetical protein